MDFRLFSRKFENFQGRKKLKLYTTFVNVVNMNDY